MSSTFHARKIRLAAIIVCLLFVTTVTQIELTHSEARPGPDVVLPNSPPVAVDDAYTVHGNFSRPAPGVLANDSDPDGDPLRTQLRSTPTSLGTALVGEDGRVSFSANNNTGTVTVIYTVCDSAGACTNGNITFTVVNGPPIAAADTYTVHRSIVVDPPGVMANDSDPDGDPLHTGWINIDTPVGTGSINNQGRVSFSARGSAVGTATVFYNVCDNIGLCTWGPVTFNVVNEAPVAVTDVYDVTSQHFISPPDGGAIANDTDPDGDYPLMAGHISTSLPQGLVTVYNSGEVRFSRYGQFAGVVPFSYNVCDSIGLCSYGTIIFKVHPMGGSSNLGRSCPVVAQPINVANGNMWLEQTDYSLPGLGERIQITRFYNSMLQQNNRFGSGWTTKYDESLEAYGDKMIRVNMPDGRAVYFHRANTTDPYVNIEAGDRGQVVVNADNSFTLTLKDGRVHQFSPIGLLLWQRDRNGNQTTLSYDANMYLVGITDAGGRTLTVTPNSNGTVAQISDPLGIIATYEYVPNTSLLKTVTYQDGAKYKFEYVTVATKIYLATVKDALDNILETHQYDPSGRAITSEKQGGFDKYTFDYSFTNNTETPYTKVTTIPVAGGPPVETKYHLDKARGRFVVKKVEGVCSCGSGGSEVTEYIFDNDLNLKKTINALGQPTTNTFDSNGNPVETMDIHGTQKFTYNPFGDVLTYKDRVDSQNSDSNVNTAAFAYDSAGNVTSYTDSLGKVTRIQYPATNNKGLPEWIKDARNNTTKFRWFTSGLLDEVENAYTKKTKFTYDGRGRLKTTTNALNHVSAYNYFDDSTRKVEMIYPNSDKITYEYDIRRTLQSITDERGKITAYEFDPQYRLKKITDPLGYLKEFGYDLMSNMTSYKDPLGNVTDYRYDDFNRLKEIEYPAAASGATRLKERMEYDKLGRIKKHFDTAVPERMTEYGYNDTTRTNTVTNPKLETTTTQYNQRFQVYEVRDAKQQIYNFTYDPVGRILSQTRAGGTMTFEYNEIGTVKKRIDYMGRETKYTYDNLNRLTEVEYLPPTLAGAQPPPASMPNQKSIYGYDDLSRLTSATNEMGTVAFQYDNRNRIKNTTDVFGHLLEYEYELTSTVNQKRLKFDGSMYAVYNFDDIGRLSNIVNSSDSTSISFGYEPDVLPGDPQRWIHTRTYPNGVTTRYEFDRLHRISRLKDSTTSSATLFDRQYSYNSARQIEQIIEPGRSRTFGYDNADRLTSVTDAAHGNETYAFDEVGNRLSSHRASSYGYQVGQFNRLTSATTPTQTVTYSHDANGNTTTKAEGSNFWRYTWDYENRLGEASTRKQKVRYKFDALGRRVQRYIVGGKENTKFIHDGEDVLVDDNAGTLTKYINGEGIDNKLRQTNGSNVSYFLSDHLRSTNGLTDASGAITSQTTYDSYGNQPASVATRYGYTGRERDDFTGLMYYRARFFDPNLGRFASEDPIGFAGGDVNLYGYVRNQPLWFRDPRGLQPGADVMSHPTVWQAIAAAAGAAAGAIASSPVTVGAGGLAIGVGIGLPVGIYTANHPSNPFVNGPLNPFGPPAPAGRPISPTSISRPYCQPISRVIPFPTPRSGPIIPPSPPGSSPPSDRLSRCSSAFDDCKASAGGDPIMEAMCALSYAECVRNPHVPVIFPNGIWVK